MTDLVSMGNSNWPKLAWSCVFMLSSLVLAILCFCCKVSYKTQGCCLTIFQGAQKGKIQKVRSPTGNVLGAAAKI